MDYSKLSDFEINKAVAEIAINGDWFLDPTDESPSWFFNHEVGGKNTVKLPDYCNNPADAWPIIVEHEITLEWEGDIVDGKEVSWCTASYGHWTESIFTAFSDDNALRAAMIVFLMMQDKSN